MSTAKHRNWITLALTALVLPAMCQIAGAQAADSPAPRTPFTAEFRITHVQVLANGTTITRETKELIARDSQGRNLRATTVLDPAGETPVTNANVFNPATGEQITWNTERQRAHVLRMPVGGQQHGCWATPSGNATSRFGEPQVASPAPRPAPVSAPGELAAGEGVRTRIQPVREDLGSDTILGVEVLGTRITRTIPAGQMGNDQPLVRTTESWMAPSLGLVVRQISDDPQTGKTTRELVSLNLDEPGPATFLPPEGYEVVTEQMRPIACSTAP